MNLSASQYINGSFAEISRYGFKLIILNAKSLEILRFTFGRGRQN
jgi:hypothetical protein